MKVEKEFYDGSDERTPEGIEKQEEREELQFDLLSKELNERGYEWDWYSLGETTHETYADDGDVVIKVKAKIDGFDLTIRCYGYFEESKKHNINLSNLDAGSIYLSDVSLTTDELFEAIENKENRDNSFLEQG